MMISHILNAAFLVLAALWAIVGGVSLYEPTSPYVPLGGDSVTPAIARKGERITVVRVYEIVRDGPIFVSRAMWRGACPKQCEIIDLPSGWLDISRGQYNIARDQTIPSGASPGVWQLVYAVHWEDIFGRRHKYLLPPLSIEVVP